MTEKKDFPVFRVGIVTLSDKGYQGEREDKRAASGGAV